MIDLTKPSSLITLIGSVVIFSIIDFVIGKATKKFGYVIPAFVFELIAIASFLFKLDFLGSVIISMMLLYIISLLFLKMKEFRQFFEGKWYKVFEKKEITPIQIFDRDETFHEIENTVLNLSKQKVGALITFERKNTLDDAIKTGTVINAPVKMELLQTIFYPGTRLHDGAVVLRGNTIVAASVYYTPTTKPLKGKYGSRHRAAIGISEITDSVTLIVSEETGRVSIAVGGELEHIKPEEVSARLSYYFK